MLYTHVGRSLPHFEAYSYTRRIKYWRAEGIGQFKVVFEGEEARDLGQAIRTEEKKRKIEGYDSYDSE